MADDVNAASRDGVALHDLNIVDGVRQNAADAYLTAAVRARPNLVIESGTRVLRLLLKSDRCVVGVVADGVQRDIRAAQEVILSAGAIDTPRRPTTGERQSRTIDSVISRGFDDVEQPSQARRLDIRRLGAPPSSAAALHPR